MRLRSKFVIFTSFFIASLAAPMAVADMNTDEFSEYISESNEARGIALLYLNAAYSAFQVANIELEGKGQPHLFCLPSNKVISETQMATWVSQDLDFMRLPIGSDVPLTIALLSALKDRFPC